MEQDDYPPFRLGSQARSSSFFLSCRAPGVIIRHQSSLHPRSSSWFLFQSTSARPTQPPGTAPHPTGAAMLSSSSTNTLPAVCSAYSFLTPPPCGHGLRTRTSPAPTRHCLPPWFPPAYHHHRRPIRFVTGELAPPVMVVPHSLATSGSSSTPPPEITPVSLPPSTTS